MISGIRLENFKSIGNPVSLETKPITILVGPNGSGKSNVLEAIALMSQSVGTTLQLEGRLAKYPSYKAIFHKLDISKPIMFGIKIDPTTNERNELLDRLNKAELNHGINDFTVTYEYFLSCQKFPPYKDETPIVKQGIFIDSVSLIEMAQEYEQGSIEQKVRIPSYKESPSLSNPGGLQSFLNASAFQVHGLTSKNSEGFDKLIQFVIDLFRKRLEGRVHLLSSTRGRVEYSAAASTDNQWVGRDGEFVLHILSKIFSDTRYRAIKEKVIHWATKFGIVDLYAGWTGANKLESTFSDPELKTILDLAVAGFGSRQALTMIVELFWSKQNDILLIEEPEISLHPEAQIHLPELFAEVIQDKKTLILTTHSEFLVLALSKPVKNGLLNSKDIAIYNLDKTSVGSQVSPLEVGDNGYIKGWIPSFTKVESELMKEFLETVPTE